MRGLREIEFGNTFLSLEIVKIKEKLRFVTQERKKVIEQDWISRHLRVAEVSTFQSLWKAEFYSIQSLFLQIVLGVFVFCEEIFKQP